ncbi:ATP-binding protein [Bacillus xiapuensis]|uniref:ATP-binding protein n=1 Tax=Bacillus xiapuensis TaxID=2014075 RepID=UPI000C24BE85|nr:ATP-binding protein [Bacillus xiapuensis]
MNRDVLMLPLDGGGQLIVAADNSGAIGEKEADAVQVSYEIVGYYSFRVAVMECLAAGAEPFACVIQNFSGDDAWAGLQKGARQAAEEAGLTNLAITGSTESNFTMSQSATGIVLLGKKEQEEGDCLGDELRYAVIGQPLVGQEVLAQPEQVAPLPLFRQVLAAEGVRAVLPAGSKGVLHEIRQLLGRHELTAEQIQCAVNVDKTAGPSTCFVVGFEADQAHTIRQLCGDLYHELKVND